MGPTPAVWHPACPISLKPTGQLKNRSWIVLIRPIALCLMICYGTTALADYRASITHGFAPGTSLGIREARPDARPSSGRYRMDLVPMSEYSAAIQHLPEPAPPNRCGPHKFEVLNPWAGEERCVGVP